VATISLTTQAFNTAQSSQIVGATARQIRHWDRQGLVKPSFSSAAGRGSRRLYSYVDLLALKTVKVLRDQGASLQKVRKCVRYLRGHLPDVSQPLQFCVLLTDGESVYLVEDEKTLIDTVRRQGQRVFRELLSIAAIDRELRERVIKLRSGRVEEVTVGGYAYQVEIEPDEESGGYVAQVAGLPGCITQGETLEEVVDMARDAIETYLEAVGDLKRRGIDLPVKGRRRSRSKASA